MFVSTTLINNHHFLYAQKILYLTFHKTNKYFSMHKTCIFLFISIFGLLFLASCSVETGKAADNLEKKQFVEEKNPVSVIVLKRQNFEKELLSNGKLRARKKSILKFETSGILKKLYLKNGQYIAAGHIIAQLDDKKARQNIENALIQLEKAKLAR